MLLQVAAKLELNPASTGLLKKNTTPIRVISKQIIELENLIDELIELDYYTTITSKRRKKMTLKRIRKLCQKMKTFI